MLRLKNSRGIKRKPLDRGNNPVLRKVKRKKISHPDLENPTHIVSQEFHTFAYKGLKNLGNTCYFNSVLQAIFHCPAFTEAIGNLPPEAISIDVINHLQLLLREITTTNALPYITPTKCLTAISNIPMCQQAGMSVNGTQQDASELLTHLLEYFEENYKSLSDIFEGKLVSTQTCQQCSYSRSKNQPFKQYSLQMDIPLSHEIQTRGLYKLMDYYHQGEILLGYKCGQCDSQNSTVKKLSISILPKILVIHLSRFCGVMKIKDFVTFPANLTIKNIVDESETQTKYSINAIVVHKGISISVGHYICYFRADQKWWKADDHIVTEVTWPTVKKKKSYLLFYQQL